MFVGKATVEFNGKTVEMDRPNPFDYNPGTFSCLLETPTGTAHAHCNFMFGQPTATKIPAVLYTPDDTTRGVAVRTEN